MLDKMWNLERAIGRVGETERGSGRGKEVGREREEGGGKKMERKEKEPK